MNTSHCNISRCETQPGYCEEHVNDQTMMGLVAIIVLPMLIAILMPMCARSSGVMSWLRDDDSPQSPSWTVLENPIDPPMYLCGFGLLPLDCGISGLLTVVIVMVFAFCIVFYAMISADRPCATGLGKCRTISCICGNVYDEGYVFMFCMMTLTSVILVQRFSRMVHHHRIQHRLLKPMLIFGSLLLTLTAIFPQRYDRNNQPEGFLAVFYGMHLAGIFGAGALLLCVPFCWFAEHWYTHRRRAIAERVPLRSLLARAAYFFAVIAFAVAMLIFGSDPVVTDQVWDVCNHIATEAECNAWPSLSVNDCAAAHGCLEPEAGPACEGFIQPNFECRWVPEATLNNWTRTIMPREYWQPAACVRLSCPLDEYARGVALEFAVLLLTLSYVSVFGLHDVKRLLDRPPPEEASLRHLQADGWTVPLHVQDAPPALPSVASQVAGRQSTARLGVCG